MERTAKQEPASAWGKLWRNWIKPIGIAALLVFSFRSTFADWNDVPSPSMEPTILVGDRIFVNKLAYDLKFPFTRFHLARWGEPERGDVVVFFSPRDGKRMVKRVVGVPGDVIEMRDNKLWINDTELLYSPDSDAALAQIEITDQDMRERAFEYEQLGDATHPIMLQPEKRNHRKSFPKIQVPPDSFFVMGDNRDNSGDSRYWGFVPRDEIVGRAVGLAFSLDRGFLNFRWDRFFRGLP